MKNKLSPFFYLGLVLNALGFALRVVLADWQHNWIPIPIFLIGTILVVFNAVKSKKGA